MLSDWLKTQKKPTRTNQIRAVSIAIYWWEGVTHFALLSQPIRIQYFFRVYSYFEFSDQCRRDVIKYCINSNSATAYPSS